VSEDVYTPIVSLNPEGGLVTPEAVISSVLGLDDVVARMVFLTVSVAVELAIEHATGVPETRESVVSVMINPGPPLLDWQDDGHTVPSGAVRVTVPCPPTNSPISLRVKVT
jgi:hypothetical protein